MGWLDYGLISERGYRAPHMVVDSQGFAHVVATSRLGGQIFHLTNGSGVWTRERLSRPPRDKEDDSAAIAIDAADGSLWVAFTRRSSVTAPNFSEGLYIVNNRGGNWSEPELYFAGGEEPSLLVSGGIVHLVFNDGSSVGGEDLNDATRPVYATNASVSWVETPLANIGRALALHQSADGRISVIVAVWDGGQVQSAHAHVATQPGVGEAAFDFEEIAGVEAGGYSYEGGFGRLGQPFVSWYSERADQTRSSAFIDGSWTQPTTGRVEAVDSMAGTHVLSVEPLGRCCDGAELWYRTSRPESASRMLFRGSIGIWPALALDEQDRPHLFLTAFESQYLVGPGY